MHLCVTHPCKEWVLWDSPTEESAYSSYEVSSNLASLWWARPYAHLQGTYPSAWGSEGEPGCSLCLPLHAPLRTVCSLYFQLRREERTLVIVCPARA